MNDDIYLYTGITSVVSDESNLGFILTNMRTSETTYYSVPGAEEYINEALAQAKASGEFDGAPGQPGDKGDPGRTPVKGVDYFTNADKTEIAEQAAGLVEIPETYVVQNTAPTDTSVLWVDPTDDNDDGFQEAVNMALAQAKASGEFDGDPGIPGQPGEKGDPGYTPVKGVDYFDGKDGQPGADGRTPVKGVDYFTESDKLEIAEQASQYVEIPSVPVQSVNGKTGAVNLNAFDVGARPSTWMPTAQDVGALPSTYAPPNQTADQVGADPKGTAANAVSQHNTADDSHNDIRLELKAINDRLTAFFDSDDQTLDELSEIVAYITSNKTLIDSITTSKVSVTDIINNLTTNVTNKPLSAAQGVALKALIDAIAIPTKVSQLTNDAGYLTQHQDISGKLDASALPTAINTALAQAKASGDFKGDPGKTPVKGTDYFTAADKTEMVNAVIAALPVYAGEVL